MQHPFPTRRLLLRAGLALSLAVLAASLPIVSAEEIGTKKATSLNADSPVDINRASPTELTAIPGIGPVLAERIVAFREKHGPFRRVEDLMKVKGIGEKSFAKFRPYVTVGPTR